MKKSAFVVLILATAMTLVGCDLLTRTLEYDISGGPSDSLSVRYQELNGDILDVTAVSPWSTSLELKGSHRPFLAFIRVDNDGAGPVSVKIRYGGLTRESGTANVGVLLDLYAIIE